MRYNDFKLKIPGNTGLQNEPIHPSERILGASEKGKPSTIMVTGHGWATYQPTFDYQVLADGDANICVPTSIANGGEYTSNWLKSNNPDLLDWFQSHDYIDNQGSVKYNNCILAVGSNTDPNAGNTPSRVYDYVRNNGFSPQSVRNYDNSWTKNRFYQNLTLNERNSGQNWLSRFDYTYYTLPVSNPPWGQTHTPEQLIEGLKYGTPRVSVDGNYERQPDGLIGSQGKTGFFYNWTHSVTLRDFEYGKWWEIHDHYTNQIIKFIWDYKFGNARVGIITPKELTGFVKVDGTPEILMYGKGGLYKDQLLSFKDGDVLKAIYGDYSAAYPRTKISPEATINKKTIFIQ